MTAGPDMFLRISRSRRFILEDRKRRREDVSISGIYPESRKRGRSGGDAGQFGVVFQVDVDEKDETVTYIHASTSKGLILGYMNLKYPDLARKDGKIINSYLKRGGGVNALASHCFNSYGTILDIPEK